MILLSVLFGSGFVCFVGTLLAYRPGEVPRVYRLIDGASGAVVVLLRLGSTGPLVRLVGRGLVYLFLATWLVLFSISVQRFSMFGRIRYLLICVLGRVFGVAPCLIFQAPCQLLDSSHVRERDKDAAQRCLGWVCLERVPVGRGPACSVQVLWCS